MAIKEKTIIKLKTNNLLKLFLALIVLYLIFFDSVVYIRPGHVGIFINRFSGRVYDKPVHTGYQRKIPFVDQIIEYPYYMQTIILTQDSREGSPGNEEIIVNSVEGQQIGCDVSLSYSLEPDKIPFFYTSFRQPVEYVTHHFVKQTIRQSMQEIVGKIPVTDFLGKGKTEVIQSVENDLKERLNQYGFVIKQFTLNRVRASEAVVTAIEQKNVMAQEAIRAQNELEKIKYEAMQKIEKAKGNASAILSVAQAQAKSNQIITESIDPTLVKYKAVEKWDGNLPVASTGTKDINLLEVKNPGK
jgi:regulator of protease activity HflC (stomatin/prohibitin superfamily)